MINYYFKYIELFDTVFLALKKKPLGLCSSLHHVNPPYNVMSSLPARLSPLCNGFIMLRTVEWQDERCEFQPYADHLVSSVFFSVMGCYFPESPSPCHYV